jgi:death-on-curing protein
VATRSCRKLRACCASTGGEGNSEKCLRIGIDERDVLALHDRLLALHGGAVGLRDDGLLKSALARPQQHFAYAESPDIVDMAAAYTWGIVRNHPFVDGNKRTGFVVGVLFLELNGYRFNASEEDAAQMVLELASGNLDEAGYIAFLRAHASLGKK